MKKLHTAGFAIAALAISAFVFLAFSYEKNLSGAVVVYENGEPLRAGKSVLTNPFTQKVAHLDFSMWGYRLGPYKFLVKTAEGDAHIHANLRFSVDVKQAHLVHHKFKTIEALVRDHIEPAIREHLKGKEAQSLVAARSTYLQAMEDLEGDFTAYKDLMQGWELSHRFSHSQEVYLFSHYRGVFGDLHLEMLQPYQDIATCERVAASKSAATKNKRESYQCHNSPYSRI